MNTSGKSTASKLLYCFLKANSVDIKDFVLTSSLPQINRFINTMSHPVPSGMVDFPDKFTLDDDINEIKMEYFNALNLFKKLKGSFFACPDEIMDWNRENLIFLIILLNNEENHYSSIVKSLLKYESLMQGGKISFYKKVFNL